jgi:hypothetical protein
MKEQHVLVLLRRLELASGDPNAVLSETSSGERSLPRAAPAAEHMIRDVVEGVLPSVSSVRAPDVIADIRGRCEAFGLKPWFVSTLRCRLRVYRSNQMLDVVARSPARGPRFAHLSSAKTEARP